MKMVKNQRNRDSEGTTHCRSVGFPLPADILYRRACGSLPTLSLLRGAMFDRFLLFDNAFFNIGIFTLSHSFVTSQDFYTFVVVKIRNYSD